MTQATSAYRVILWHLLERYLHADMNSSLRLPAARHREEAFRYCPESSYYLKFNRICPLYEGEPSRYQ